MKVKLGRGGKTLAESMQFRELKPIFPPCSPPTIDKD
jgi:hypothetical protein